MVSTEQYFAGAGERYRQMGSPFYAALAEASVGDPEIMALAGEAQPGQPPTHLFYGAVHYLLLTGPAHPLGACYASLTEHPAPAAEAFPLLQRFCRERRDDIVAILRSRTVQTTMVARAAHLLPAMAAVAAEAGEPLSILEVGCSVGLLTLFDQYRYDFGPLGRFGEPGRPLVSGGRFEGTPPALSIPRIAARIGVDLNPVDPADAAERAWIDALLPPDWVEERRQLRQAMDWRARSGLEVATGDALALLGPLLDRLPGPVCVFHSHCLYQWPAGAKAGFERALDAASRGRTLHRIGIEPPERPVATPGGFRFDIFRSVHRDGASERRLLGWSDGWGRVAGWY
jgi:hypothetical protein